MPAPGFPYASGSKALCLSTICTSALLFSSPDAKYWHAAPARLAVAALGFARPIELALGVSILYGLRHVERIMGTRAFLSFLTASTSLAVVVQWAAVRMLGMPCSSGPYAPLFSLLVIYYAHVPAVALSRANHAQGDLDAWSISQKVPMYVGSLVLAALQGWNSLFPACIGLACGIVCNPSIGRLVFPDYVASFFSRYVDSWFASPTQALGDRADARAARRGGPRANADNLIPPSIFGAPQAAAINRPLAVAIREADVDSLMGMGFEREVAERALRENGGDVNQAANALFSNTS